MQDFFEYFVMEAEVIVNMFFLSYRDFLVILYEILIKVFQLRARVFSVLP